MEGVSWEMCSRVLEHRLGLSLATEAQWEYAARAGTMAVWWTGNAKASLKDAANLADSFCKDNGGPLSWRYEEWLNDGYAVHAPVGSFRANAFGLHDVVGNLWEWCRDGWGERRGGEGNFRPGTGERRISGPRFRVSRGGSFKDTASVSRATKRNGLAPGYRGGPLGVRPARVCH